MTQIPVTTENTPLELQLRLRFSMKITILKNSDLALKIPTFGYLAAALLRSAADPKVGIL